MPEETVPRETMPEETMPEETATHEVLNQPPPLGDLDLWSIDPALIAGVERGDAAWATERLHEVGLFLGLASTFELGELANRYPPELRTHDRFGHRLDVVRYHPSWHALMEAGVRFGLHALPWVERRIGAQVARSSMLYLFTQVEAGVTCPLSMTYASVPALRCEPAVAEEWLPRIASDRYDQRFLPASEKEGCLLGMAMTEKQGGSDLRANTTRAERIGNQGEVEAFELVGHKWFCSAPMCDAFLTLAQLEEGLTCFLVPRFRPDGRTNAIHLQRLKDKLGNRSNASSEVEYHGAWAARVGPRGRGIATILEMVQHTRLDCVAGSAGMMRQALTQALHHAAHRRAFGRDLIDQPLMRNVLADLAIETEAAVAAMARLASAYDRGAQEPGQAAYARLATAALKYWICRRAPAVVGEALECLGGNGYVEDSMLPRLYREAPLLSIWEGSGNVICLDVLRALEREPEAVPALRAELERAASLDPRLEATSARLLRDLDRPIDRGGARRFTERLALALQGAALVGAALGGAAPSEVIDGFFASRLGDEAYRAFGTLPDTVDVQAIVERARPRS